MSHAAAIHILESALTSKKAALRGAYTHLQHWIEMDLALLAEGTVPNGVDTGHIQRLASEIGVLVATLHQLRADPVVTVVTPAYDTCPVCREREGTVPNGRGGFNCELCVECLCEIEASGC